VLHQDETHPSRELVRADDGGREMKARSASAIYREAAKRIENGKNGYSCCAVDGAAGNSSDEWHPLVSKYRSMFDEGAGFISQYEKYSDARELRILALLLMSEIAKDEQ
jgi:hypothetical protein